VRDPIPTKMFSSRSALVVVDPVKGADAGLIFAPKTIAVAPTSQFSAAPCRLAPTQPPTVAAHSTQTRCLRKLPMVWPRPLLVVSDVGREYDSGISVVPRIDPSLPLSWQKARPAIQMRSLLGCTWKNAAATTVFALPSPSGAP
jgi:hypothetical protein